MRPTVDVHLAIFLIKRKVFLVADDARESLLAIIGRSGGVRDWCRGDLIIQQSTSLVPSCGLVLLALVLGLGALGQIGYSSPLLLVLLGRGVEFEWSVVVLGQFGGLGLDLLRTVDLAWTVEPAWAVDLAWTVDFV